MLAVLSAAAALFAVVLATEVNTPPAAPSAEPLVCQPDYWGC